MTNFKTLITAIKTKEESLIYDLEKDFKNNQVRFGIKLFSELGSSVINLVVFIILGIFLGFGALSLFVLVYAFQLAFVETIKIIFKRKRPSTYKNDSLLKIRASSGSFPSGHTSNAFAAALLISNVMQTPIYVTSVLFMIAGLVALSRLFLGKHYIVDVVGGAILGITLTVIGMQLYIWGYSALFL